MLIETTIMDLLRERGPGKSICPSEAAWRVAGDDEWRPLMDKVRASGRQLAAAGQIVVTQRGVVVDPETARGAIRYRLKDESDDT